jgi:predicted metal-dependent hydrolase
VPFFFDKEIFANKLERLRLDAKRLCKIFGLKNPRIVPLNPGDGAYGYCQPSTGLIEISLEIVGDGKHRIIPYYELLDTLCHELAHLRCINHDEKFREQYVAIKAAAERLGMFYGCDGVLHGGAYGD